MVVRRETDDGITHLTAQLPAVLSVSEKINEPRYPSFKGIMAAKKKPVSTITLADTGPDTSDVDLPQALTKVIAVSPKPPKPAGEKVEDSGDGGVQIAAFLAAQKLIRRRARQQKRRGPMAEVLALVDHRDGEIKKSTYELRTAARELGAPSAVVVAAPGT